MSAILHIGISDFNSVEYVNPDIERKLRRMKKYEDDQKVFNTPVWDFTDENILPLKVKELLHNLECRADRFLGDTRWYTSEIVKALGFSKSTVDRYLKKLKDLGFISIITKAYSKDGKVYKNRVIRCKRIWLKYKFFVVDSLYSKSPLWDIRRTRNQRQAIKLAAEYNIKVPYKFYNPKISFEKHHSNLLNSGLISYEQDKLLKEYHATRFYFGSVARAVFGWQPGIGSNLMKLKKKFAIDKKKIKLIPSFAKEREKSMDWDEEEEFEMISFRSPIERERDKIVAQKEKMEQDIKNNAIKLESLANLGLSSSGVVNNLMAKALNSNIENDAIPSSSDLFKEDDLSHIPFPVLASDIANYDSIFDSDELFESMINKSKDK